MRWEATCVLRLLPVCADEQSKVLGELQTNTLGRTSMYINIQNKANICALILHNYWILQIITKTKSF